MAECECSKGPYSLLKTKDPYILVSNKNPYILFEEGDNVPYN